MAKESTTSSNDSNFFNAFNPNTEATREWWGLQMKTGQAMLDQTLKFAQAWTDFSFGQAQDAAKLSQDCLKQSMHAMDSISKTFWNFSERTTKQ